MELKKIVILKILKKLSYKSNLKFKKAGLINPLKSKNKKHKETKIVKEIGCTLEFLAEHLEKQFQKGMNWENYGPGFVLDEFGKAKLQNNYFIIPVKNWVTDHVRPASSFNFNNKIDSISMNHWTNLQPLWGIQNGKKGEKLNFQITECKDPNLKSEIDMNKIKASKIWSNKRLDPSYNTKKSGFRFF